MFVCNVSGVYLTYPKVFPCDKKWAFRGTVTGIALKTEMREELHRHSFGNPSCMLRAHLPPVVQDSNFIWFVH